MRNYDYDSLIVFHRPTRNGDEAHENQKAFFKTYGAKFVTPQDFSYMTEDRDKARKIEATLTEYLNGETKRKFEKPVIIMQSYLSRTQYCGEFDMYKYFYSLKGYTDFYLMDSWGKLWKEVESL